MLKKKIRSCLKKSGQGRGRLFLLRNTERHTRVQESRRRNFFFFDQFRPLPITNLACDAKLVRPKNLPKPVC